MQNDDDDELINAAPKGRRKFIQCGPGTKPSLPYRLMVNPAGRVRRVTTATSIHVDPSNNNYGRQTIIDRRLKGWLYYDRCPLEEGAVANTGNEPACPGPLKSPCAHLQEHIESRRRNRAADAKTFRDKQMSAFIKQQEKSDAALAESRTQHKELMQTLAAVVGSKPATDEMVALKESMEMLKAEIASLKRKPGKNIE